MKLKQLTFLLLVLFTCGFSYAQEASDNKKLGKVGISFSSFGKNDVIRFGVTFDLNKRN